MTLQRLVMCAAVVLGLSGCASDYLRGSNIHVDYDFRANAGLSMLWDDGLRTFIVPQRQTLIEAVRASGKPLELQVQGSYLFVTGVHQSLEVQVQGRWVPISRAKRAIRSGHYLTGDLN